MLEEKKIEQNCHFFLLGPNSSSSEDLSTVEFSVALFIKIVKKLIIVVSNQRGRQQKNLRETITKNSRKLGITKTLILHT